jgi:hypothetical protein
MRFVRSGVVAAVAVASAVAFAAPAGAVAGGPPSTIAAPWAPHLLTDPNGTEYVRQLVPCGNMMYAVGTFTQVKRWSTVYTRTNAFSFNATTGVISSWDPEVTGDVVNSIALSPDCSTAYLGGKFTAIGSTSVKNIAAVSTTTGQVLSTFAHSASGQVAALLMTGGHLLVGGFFTGINGSARSYLASLNPSTGRDDGYVNLAISGTYQYTDASGTSTGTNPTRVWNFSLSPNGTRLLAMGDFTSVGGQHRQQIFMLDLGATSATVDPWYSAEFDQYCMPNTPFWLQDASWSPDGSTVYIAATGWKPATGPAFYKSNPRAGLCDSAAAFPSTSSSTLSHLWVNYTGCDSLYATAADASTVYVAGHERYANNPLGCDYAGQGAVNAPGLGGLSPASGSATWAPGRDRGEGADDLVVTSAGLWIASDNAYGSNVCGTTADGSPGYGHAGICFLPY